MALIRCPNCDTLHDLDDAFLATGRRKVRCASCRTVFSTTENESDQHVIVAMPLPEPKAPRGTMAAAGVDAVPMAGPGAAAGSSKAAQDTEAAEPVSAEASDAGDSGTSMFSASTASPDTSGLGSAMDAEISADDLEALFADEAPAAPVADSASESAEASGDAAENAAHEKEFDPASLAMAQDSAAMAAAVNASAPEAPGERRSRRAGSASKPARAKPAAAPPRGGMIVAMVMAASIGTLATLVLLRQETVRLFPATSKVFDAIGVSASARGLDIIDVQSQMMLEDGRETLEVTGRVTNNAKTAQKIPVLRLSVRAGSGNELYVWTATSEVSELGPGESTRFVRRLASPPPDSHSVMVRFVAKDDIVAAVR